MSYVRVLARLVLPALVTAGVPVAVVAAPALPVTGTPSGLSAKDEPHGGRIVSGLVTNASSSVDATRKALAEMRGYFDRRPTVRGAVASSDRRSSILLFDAALRGVPVRGLIVTTAQSGSAEVAFLFDDPKRLEGSLRAMEADLASRTAAALGNAPSSTGKAASCTTLVGRWNAAAVDGANVALTRRTFSDNSGSIGIASDYTLRSGRVGSFTATGADGAIVRGGQSLTAFDPSAGGSNLLDLPLIGYGTDVAADWLSIRRAYMERQGLPDDGLTIASRSVVKTAGVNRSQTVIGRAKNPSGEPLTYIAWLRTVEPTRGIWTVGWSIVWSPERRLAQDGPKLLAMMRSFRGNQGVIDSEFESFDERNAARERAFTRASVASNEASRILLERNSAEVRQQSAEAQDWIRREGASTIHLLRNEDSVFTADGSHVTVPLGTSLGYGSVPISQYIEGVDY